MTTAQIVGLVLIYLLLGAAWCRFIAWGASTRARAQGRTAELRPNALIVNLLFWPIVCVVFWTYILLYALVRFAVTGFRHD